MKWTKVYDFNINDQYNDVFRDPNDFRRPVKSNYFQGLMCFFVLRVGAVAVTSMIS